MTTQDLIEALEQTLKHGEDCRDCVDGYNALHQDIVDLLEEIKNEPLNKGGWRTQS